MLRDKLTIVISSCDVYSDLWDNHVALLEENWADRDINTVIVTDEQNDKCYSNVSVFSAGESLEMPQRIKTFLKTCQTKYVLLTLDDYYVKSSIDNAKIERAISIMENHDLDYLRFWPYPHEKIKMEGVKKAFWIELEGNYKVNLYPAIWKKDFLLKTVTKELSSWQYEVSLTQIAKSLNARCAYSVNNEFCIVDVIRKGKLLRPAKKFLDTKGMYLRRELISRKQEIILTIMYYGKEILPKSILRMIKKLLEKMGYNFISKDI